MFPRNMKILDGFSMIFHVGNISDIFRPFEELKEKLWALAERRPAEPTKLMGQAFAGKKSLGEMASAPQTSDPNLKLVDSLSHCLSLL